jgi:hypothetical protein
MEKNNFSYAKRKVFAIPILLFVISLIGLMSALPAYQPFPYDTYSGTVNTTLWSATAVGDTRACFYDEVAGTYIHPYTSSGNSFGACTATVTSLLLPPLDYIENISLFTLATAGTGSFDDVNAGGYLFGILSQGAGCSHYSCQDRREENWTLVRNYSAGTNYFNYNADGKYCHNFRVSPKNCNTGTYTYYNNNGTALAVNNYITASAYIPFVSSGVSASSAFYIYIINYTLNNHIITVNSSYPPENSIFNNGNITFNGTAITNNYNTGINSLSNMSLFINGISNQTVSVTGTGVTNSSSFNLTNLPLGSYVWSIQACDNSGTCRNSENRTLQISYLTIVNQSYTTPVYETSAQTFEINTQFNTVVYPNAFAYLNYSGTIYTSNITKVVNGLNVKYSTIIDMPTVNGTTTKVFHWDLYSDPLTIQNSVDTNQTVNPIAFSICGGAGGSINFLNMNYFDELNPTTPVNLSVPSSSWTYWLGSGTTYKSYSFSTTSQNITHSFCFTPAEKILFTSTTYQYGISGTYPYRTFQTAVLTPPYFTLTNSTTNQNLYTIAASESSPITFQISDSTSANVIQGATVTITKNIGGSTIQVFSGLTDSAGTVNVWLSTTTQYTITAFKSGCGSNTATITPVGSYNMQLNCAGNLTKYVSQIDGVAYQRTPADGATSYSGTIDYGYYVQSVLYPIKSAKFELVDGDGNLVGTNETYVASGYPFCTNSSCLLSLQYTTACGDNIKGRYYINLGNTTNNTYVKLEGDALWRFICINTNNSQLSFTKFIAHFNQFFFQWSAGGQAGTNCRTYTTQSSCNAVSYCKWLYYQGYQSDSVELCVLKDDYNKGDFNRILVIFFGMVIVLFIIGKTTGYEMTNPGSFVMFMTGAIIIMSFVGMFRFSGATPWAFFDQWIYALICTAISVGYNISIVRRYSA